jgi:hypothetical protein
MFWQFSWVELVFADAVESFDAGDSDFGSAKSLETEHRANPRLHSAMILLNDVIEIFR